MWDFLPQSSFNMQIGLRRFRLFIPILDLDVARVNYLLTSWLFKSYN